MAKAITWQSRPLEAMLPAVLSDALRLKIRGNSFVSNKAVYPALIIQADGQRDMLRLWIHQTEIAKFRLSKSLNVNARLIRPSYSREETGRLIKRLTQ